MRHNPAALRRSLVLAVILSSALLLLTLLALSIGPVKISFGDLLSGQLSEMQLTAVWQLRLPRALLAIVAGAALALSGALMQTYFRNPLAEPYITGVSAGGALGAVLCETLGLSGRLANAGSALLGAGLITAALYAFALRGRSPSAASTLLLGIALGTFCGALVWFLLLLQGPAGAQQAMAWLLGRVSTVGYGDVLMLLPALLLGGAVSLIYSRQLDALLLGDEKAASLGVDLATARRWILGAAALLAAACVAFCGVIAFVGLMVPHVVRACTGPLHARLLPLSALGGAVLLLLTDLGARTLHPPGEIPLTVLTSLIGAPFFIWVLLRSRAAQSFAAVCLVSLLSFCMQSKALAQQDEVIDLDEPAGEAIEVVLDQPGSAEVDLGSGNVTGAQSLQQMFGGDTAVTVIERAELQSALSVGSVLERVPGVDIRSDGGFGQLSVAQIRGSRAQQVLVLIDGQPLSPGQVSDLGAIPAGMLERIEVVRGPEAARFGSGALGGVINLVTLEPGTPDSSPDRGKGCCPTSEEQAEISAGSHGLYRAQFSLRTAESSLFASHEQAENDYSFRRGAGGRASRLNNDARIDTLWGRWRSGETDWSAGFRLLERGVPGAAEFPTLKARLQRETLWTQAAQYGWRAEIQAEHSKFSDPEPFLGASISQEDTRAYAGLSLGSFAIDGGDWGLRPRFDYVDSRQYGSHSRSGLDASYSWRESCGDWTHSAELGAVASSDIGVDPSLRLGTSWRVDKQNRLYASAGYSVRHPDFSELYLSGGGSVQGNPELDPEQVTSFELGADLGYPNARLSLAAFYSDYLDSILFLPVSSYLVRASNTGRADVAGMEALFDWQLKDAGRSARLPLTRRECWLTTSYTWLPVAQFASGTPLAARAEHHLHTRLQYSAIDGASPPGPGERLYGRGWRGSFSLDYLSEMPADLLGSLVIEPRTVCGLELTRSLGAQELQLGVSNMFDVNTRDSWNYPLPGREFFLTLRSQL